MATDHRLASIDSRTFAARRDSNPIVILPVGAVEAHGPHLPLGADLLQAEATAVQLAARLDAWVAPTLAYGSCPGAREFPGTVSLSLATLESYARGVLLELARQGIRRIVVLSGHAERGHMAALREAAAETMRSYPAARIVVLSDYDFVYELRGLDAPPTDGHGGLLETSRVMAIAPETVGPERPVVAYRASRFVPGSPTPEEWPESVIGDTRGASAELGAKLQEHVLNRLVTEIRQILPA
ncbi:MAG: creatininase family protein [Thermoplasmata archaeon]